MKHSFRWLYPFFLGLVMFNTLRAVTDLTKDGGFWVGSIRMHIIAQAFVILMCYIYDIKWRKRLQNRKYTTNRRDLLLREYGIVLLDSFIPLNIALVVGQYIGIFYMGSGLIDYMLINVVFIPLLLIYYAIMSNDIVNKNNHQQALLLEKIKNEQLETELKYLKSQYHPHFLFNALNTIYFQIDERNKDAKESIEQLSDLLRYQLYDNEKQVTLEQEINYLKSYIAFQQLRMSERLVFDMYFDSELKEQKIHPLLFQPLIENAFKYVRGDYVIRLELRLIENKIQFKIENSTMESAINGMKGSGIGIDNLKRRLDILYPNKHSLEFRQAENMFMAELMIESN
ncbi:MAG: sensor histidine kinase [Dysgonomonas sp.]